MKREHSYLLFFLLFLLISTSARAGWQCPVTNYTRHAYQAGTQNWMLEQYDNGWIYVANNKGLLEFDGMNWNLYSVRNAKMRAVKKGGDGRIYVGGIGQFGYFEPDNLGGLRYRALSDSLLSYINMGVVRNILVDGMQVYFQADRYIFHPKDGRTEYVDYGNQISSSALLNHKLYIASEEGLLMLEGKDFIPVPGTELTRTFTIVSMLTYKGNILLVTRSHGIFIYDGVTLHKYATGIEDFLLQKHMYGADIRGSLLALGSVQDGICLLDLETGAARRISTDYGLQNKTVHGLLFDVEGNLWLALDNGIDYIHLNSRLSSLYGGTDLQIGSGYASCYYRGSLYLGTNQGVYRTEFPGASDRDTPMNFVKGTEGQMWSFLQYDDKLFCASDDGIFVIGDDRGTERIDGIKGVRSIVPLPNHEDVLIAGTYGVNRGLYLLMKKQNRWTVVTKIENCDLSCKSLLAESSTYLWMTNKGRGVYRLLLSDDLRKVRQEKKYNHFPFDYDAQLSWVGSEIAVASHYGLWRFDQKKDSLVEYREMERLLDGKTAYSYIYKDDGNNIWYAAGGILKLLRYDWGKKTYARQVECFLKGALVENFESVSVVGNSAIISTEDGFSKLELPLATTGKNLLSLQIRRVYLTGQRDSLIYGRSYRYDDEAVLIPYAHNSLRIEYSVSDYGSSQPTLFSFRLSNDSEKGHWSEYSENNTKEFTGLPEGKYTFSVRLLADKGEEPPVTSFTFEILPPWYRTWWSYLVYASAAVLLLYYIYRRIVSFRKHLLMQKELELYHQKQEFKKESDLKDRTIDSLKEENLQSELRHKSEELVRTTLNIVRKNEMLLELKKGVDGISHSLNENDQTALRRRVLRLQGQITTNIEHDDDLQAFQSTFDSVHHDFFKNLSEAYPDLNNKEKLLCAYIQMNLLTKEIAPLLNISVRGVEISRYRLRRKLDLGERDNLTEFLQRFSK
ncbi:transcriptional regulator [Bacteroides sp. GD17]|jgi:ligand-binding sensor domain-containing protein/DNA-binding CsgD family transcriptional regulator|uniref:transcriptional regulator n=1 Tax=Bacteroides sp. GD17 TaxID=3139826 RepID=UPI0025FB653E|nr:transcriptional regulator [uncultured Bacteroides sp.]